MIAPEGFKSLSVDHRALGWQERLIYLVDEELAKPFDWVNAHCVDLIGASILACHGPDHPAFKAIPRYKTEAAVKRKLIELGGMQAILDKYFVEIPALHAFDGDAVLIRNPETEAMASGLMMGGRIVGKQPPGSRLNAFYLPISAGHKFYRV